MHRGSKDTLFLQTIISVPESYSFRSTVSVQKESFEDQEGTMAHPATDNLQNESCIAVHEMLALFLEIKNGKLGDVQGTENSNIFWGLKAFQITATSDRNPCESERRGL